MRYKLQRNANGMITQCENADGGNIYAQREEINKKALENLKKAEPSGKLGTLSNLQVFNANISAFASGTGNNAFLLYNNTVNFPDLMDPCFVFGSANGSNASGLYYNIVGINATLKNLNSGVNTLIADSYIDFYLGQNILGATTPQVTKIPGPPFNSFSTASVTLDTSGSINSFQAISAGIVDNANIIPTNTLGVRASGLGLKTISLSFAQAEDLALLSIDIDVYVDVSSVSSTY
tara:strand:+ start:100 stop:804 length:705 start_codon:yes stop_codon:yes gene_type:complete